MVAAEQTAAIVLAVRVAAGVSVAFLTVVSGGRVVGVDATCQAIATAFPVFEGVCLRRAVRGGGGVLSYEKALTGLFFVWRVPGGTAPEPCSAGNAAVSEAAIMSRRRVRSRHGRDAPERRVRVATDESAATWSRRPALSQLSWLVWDAEDSLEFYPAQASQSFFSLPRSLRPRNRLERSRIRRLWTHLTSYGVSDREYFPYRVSFSFASALPFVGETSQQRQGTRRAEETGR
ncbi:hypothetical protein Taro_052805 [Colocasia esculenta]|uniref:Uncharacterized protein n=1 Tax=Colocasia esculenta TaxID=4460 RepID=A0A843XKS8_COLES|nr:hypothetical protein [Colocasia esculenta]